MKKHMENRNWGRNVDPEEQYNDYPVALKICDANNRTTSSSDEDDPYNLLRGKYYPKNGQQLRIQEKFTMPQISLGIEAVPNNNNNNEEKDGAKYDKELCKKYVQGYDKIKNSIEENVILKNKGDKKGKTYSKFSVDRQYNYNLTQEESGNIFEEITRNKIEQYDNKDQVEVDRSKDNKKTRILKVSCTESLRSKSEDIGNNNTRKSLLNKLLTRCRTISLDDPENELLKINNKPKETKNMIIDNRKIRSIWDWRPNKEKNKVGYKLDFDNLNLPKKIPNFINLFKQFCKPNCADMKIIIDDTVFHCHKIVLQCYSKFFQTHIRSKCFKKDVLIEIPHNKVNKNVFMDIYIWMLNCPKNCRNNFTNYNILNLLIASTYLKIDELEKHCWNYIKDRNNFDESTAFNLYWEARHSNYWPVMELMITRVKLFFLTLVQSDRFTKMTENELHLLLDSNYIAVHSEIEVLFALVLWLRKKNLSDPWECSLFRLIRFSQMSPIQLVELQSMSELHYITKRYPVNEMIENGLRTAIRREHAQNSNNLTFKDPEPQTRNWLRRTVIYKSFNDFIDTLIKRRSTMKNPNCELIRRETLEGLKIPTLQLWTPIVRN